MYGLEKKLWLLEPEDGIVHPFPLPSPPFPLLH